ncbi:MAG: protein YgfX [Bermanella sp.]
MYNPVNARVLPSRWLISGLYGLHVVLLLVSLGSISAVFYPYLVPLFALQAWHLERLYSGRLLYLKTRHWRFHNGKWTLQVLQGSPAEQRVNEVQVALQHLWPNLVIFRFKLDGRWRWEIIVGDALDAESFRQLRAVLNLSNQQQKYPGGKDGH